MRSLTIRVKKKQIYLALLILTYLLRSVTDALFVAQEVSSVWTAAKYITLFSAIFYGMMIITEGKKPWQCTYFLKHVGIAVAVFAFISLLKMIYTGVYSMAILKQAFVMLFPAIVTVITMSIVDQEDIYKCFCWILSITFVVYCVLEIGVSLFTEEQFALVSFETSSSPFESHYSAGTAMALCAYFSYFRKNKTWLLLSIVFVFLTFKRLILIGAFVLAVIPMIINVSARVNKRIPALCSIGFSVLTVLYYWLLIPENQEILMEILNIDSVAKFTSTRSLFFETIYNSPFFVNFGWGSCEAHLGRLLEMELIQILIETSFVGLVIFSVSYWRLAGTSIYGMLYMGFNFLNLLTSHSLGNGFIWVLIFISFASVDSDTYNIDQRIFKIRKKYIG